MISGLLLLLKGAKLGKIALTAVTMLLSIGVYTLLWGWPFAVGLVGLVFIHEMGHYVAARQRGIEVGAVTIIPFIAWTRLNDMPRDVETQAWVGLGGPLAGSLAALACFEAGRLSGQEFLLGLAYTGFLLNLVNLLPIIPFDGGRITAVVSSKMWLVGVPLLVALFFVWQSPMILLVALMAWPSLRAAFRGDPPDASFFAVPPQTRLHYALAYFGLVAYLAAMSWSLHQQLPQGV